ncbi:hypothetical protein ACS5NO_30885 [Larkinella sp. GY13]|uniref:hypothetical protein n=1 Tax=Larkinella sp. GY13 TaxID=3453720 RepID=UPI003EE85FC5
MENTRLKVNWLQEVWQVNTVHQEIVPFTNYFRKTRYYVLQGTIENPYLCKELNKGQAREEYENFGNFFPVDWCQPECFSHGSSAQPVLCSPQGEAVQAGCLQNDNGYR